jgi:hypothetical protein
MWCSLRILTAEREMLITGRLYSDTSLARCVRSYEDVLCNQMQVMVPAAISVRRSVIVVFYWRDGLKIWIWRDSDSLLGSGMDDYRWRLAHSITGPLPNSTETFLILDRSGRMLSYEVPSILGYSFSYLFH